MVCIQYYYMQFLLVNIQVEVYSSVISKGFECNGLFPRRSVSDLRSLSPIGSGKFADCANYWNKFLFYLDKHKNFPLVKQFKNISMGYLSSKRQLIK